MGLTTAAQQILPKADAMGDNASLPDAFWELVAQYRSVLVNQAMSILNDLQDAEDVVQETFCEAVRSGEKLCAVRSLGAWLRTINRANALNRLAERRSKHKQQEAKRSDPAEKRNTTGGFSAIEIRESVCKAIEKLPPKMRSMLVLRFWEHLGFDEIAVRLRIHPGTARRLYCDAVIRLHQQLGDYFETTKSGGGGAGSAPPQA